ncbi:tRNA (guanine-1-)-methyltransferase [Candidatus Sulfotelmatomonas gaucii]|uniref:tRNA (guanine-N(1)-)-methyltransferase n=1 Tax=Candidatus Sulfuritelmatomonas gaucii TaxID=2043161 RepID=A0A2N9L3T3_9BACT|nr:tRNA (guanine-1-)-methyltransferase [Candidatus Sulfotelmatomonas gaucii]
MRFDIVTIFPGFFEGVLAHGILRRALKERLVTVETHDLREHAHDKHRTVDDRPFGGGEGMVLKPEPLAETLEALGIRAKAERGTTSTGSRVILLSAQGQLFTQATARELASLDRLVLVCGRYEGVDERINELYCDLELSIGDYVLSGGELAAAVVLDATMRLIPGVLGNEASGEFESFGVADAEIDVDVDGVPRSQHGAGGLLDYPHYTRPGEFHGLRAPEVLLNGDHAEIRRWRREQQLRKTLQNRPELLERASLSVDDQKLLAAMRANQK